MKVIMRTLALGVCACSSPQAHSTRVARFDFEPQLSDYDVAHCEAQGPKWPEGEAAVEINLRQRFPSLRFKHSLITDEAVANGTFTSEDTDHSRDRPTAIAFVGTERQSS